MGQSNSHSPPTASPQEPSRTALEAYLAHIASHPLLTHEDEIRLSTIIHHAPSAIAKQAKHLFFESNLRLVRHHARAYERFGCPLEDLLAEGNLGLLLACEKWDPAGGAAFATYAAWYIKNSLRKATNDFRLIHIPISSRKQITPLFEAINHHRNTTGSDPTPDDLAQALEVPTHEVEHLLAITTHPLSIHSSTNSSDSHADDDHDPLWEIHIESHPSPIPSPSEIIEQQDQLAELRSRIQNHLEPREQTILIRRFDLDHSPEGPQTLDAVAKELGYTRERIRQLETQAIEKLRRLYKSQDRFIALLTTQTS